MVIVMFTCKVENVIPIVRFTRLILTIKVLNAHGSKEILTPSKKSKRS